MTKYYLLIYSSDYYEIKKTDDLFIVDISNKNDIPLVIMPIDDEFIKEIKELESKDEN